MAAGIKPIISQFGLGQNISQSLFNLQQEAAKIESGYSPQETTALEFAKELAKKVCDLREKILTGMSQESNIHKTLKDLPIPLSKAQALTTILTHSSIQFEDKLKYVLSKIASIYWEIIGFQVSARGRRVYKGDVEELKTGIQNVIKTLPKSEMKTQFALRCCEFTAKKLQPREGKIAIPPGEEGIRQERAVNLEQQEAAEEGLEYRQPQPFKQQNQEPSKTKEELQKEDQALMDQLAEAQTNRELLETQLENKKLLKA